MRKVKRNAQLLTLKHIVEAKYGGKINLPDSINQTIKAPLSSNCLLQQHTSLSCLCIAFFAQTYSFFHWVPHGYQCVQHTKIPLVQPPGKIETDLSHLLYLDPRARSLLLYHFLKRILWRGDFSIEIKRISRTLSFAETSRKEKNTKQKWRHCWSSLFWHLQEKPCLVAIGLLAA